MARGRCEDRVLWGTIFWCPLRPPGLSVASLMRSSWSMSPALRNAFEASVRLPEGAGALESIGWFVAVSRVGFESDGAEATGRAAQNGA